MKMGTMRVLLVTGALILFVLLFIAPRTAEAGKAEAPKAKAVESDLGVFEKTAANSLDPSLRGKHERLANGNSHDSLVLFWDQLGRPDLAAWHAGKLAAAQGSAPAWKAAGNRYFYAVQFSRDRNEIPALYANAIRSFSKAVEKDPSDTDARIMLASCYVDGTEDPMKGISMLREVEKTDSNNLKLQLAFASFSMKSGQLDKAISRYRKALRADSSYIEAYLHLADAYEKQGDIEATSEMLRRFARRTDDPAARAEVNKYIEQLKRNSK